MRNVDFGKFGRRAVLRGAGASLALPFLESLMPKMARAQAAIPTRLVIFSSPQGTLLERWRPTSQGDGSLRLSELLAPLEPFRDRLNVISGIANEMPRYHESNGHNAPGHTLLTAHLCDSSATSDGQLLPQGSRASCEIGANSIGPSVDHALATALGVNAINLSVSGYGDGDENRMFYRSNPLVDSEPNGARAGASLENDPEVAFREYLGSLVVQNPNNPEPAPMSFQDRLVAQRLRVLDATREALTSLSAQVSVNDRRLLAAHEARLRDLQGRLGGGGSQLIDCGEISQNLPGGYQHDNDHQHLWYQAQIDVMVQLLACGVSPVVTLQDVEYGGPQFQILEAPIPAEVADRGGIALPGARVDGWHAQVHGDVGGTPNENQNLIAGFTFYATQFRALLERMDGVQEANGRTLLDNSLVLWISEFGDGGSHSPWDLPVVLAGSAGGLLPTGRYLETNGATTGDLYTSILRVFGQNVDSFGFNGDSDLNHGGISGLV